MPLKHRADGERGAVAIMFALLITGLLGLGVLLVDVGQLYVEGRQLQNGAENVALAVARTCATSGCNTTAGNDLADGNSQDGTSTVETVCGTAPGLSGCGSTGERARYGCHQVGPLSAPYVQVQTLSRLPSGSNLLPGTLMRVLNPGYTGTAVRACARASYGNPSGLTGELPLAISSCEFTYWRDLYGLVNPVPGPPAAEAVLYFHNTGDVGASNCPARDTANNADSPGGFGWLTTNGSCRTATTLAGDATEKQGNSVPSDCTAADFAAMHNRIVNVPIYNSVREVAPGKYEYDLAGYAAFYLSGYRLSGSPDYNRASPNLGVPCSGNARCISGWFTTEPVPATGPLVAGTTYGSLAIRSSG